MRSRDTRVGAHKAKHVYPCPGGCQGGWAQKMSRTGAGWIKYRCRTCKGRGYITK